MIKKTVNTYGIYFFVVHTLGDEDIRHRQRLVQAVCLQFSTTSIIWKLLAFWNSLCSPTYCLEASCFVEFFTFSYTDRRCRTVLLVTEGQYNGGTEICPSLRTSCLQPFVYYFLYSIVNSIIFTGSHFMHHTLQYVTATHFITSPCSVHSPTSHYILLYGPCNVPVLCQNSKCHTVEAHFLKLL